MRQVDLIREYIRGEKRYGAAGHCGYTDQVFYNYGTELCSLDRESGVARLNAAKYSVTTSKIQNYLRQILREEDWWIEEYDGPDACMWNYGYMGAEPLKARDFRPSDL